MLDEIEGGEAGVGRPETKEDTGVNCDADFLIFSLSFSSFGRMNIGVEEGGAVGGLERLECLDGEGEDDLETDDG